MHKEQPGIQEVITGHANLRAALRDTEKYSSDLQGDADVRDYRQIPLEVDPPKHHVYRALLGPLFVRPAIEIHAEIFLENSKKLLMEYFRKPGRDVTQDLCLPLVMHNLGTIFNRPQDVEEWISWGPDVWTAESDVRDGKVLNAYLERVYSEALDGESEDIWSEIASMKINEELLTPLEFKGIASVLLAGGRDTVIKLMTGMLWHLANKKEDYQLLKDNPENMGTAISEFLRFFTPLPKMNRTTTPESAGTLLPDDRYVSMSFISANFDESAFPNPETIDLLRPKNPHLSFGFGPHTCLGIHVAEVEAKAFLKALLELDLKFQVKDCMIEFHDTPYQFVPDNFKRLELGLTS